jgi:hypothetical protein
MLSPFAIDAEPAEEASPPGPADPIDTSKIDALIAKALQAKSNRDAWSAAYDETKEQIMAFLTVIGEEQIICALGKAAISRKISSYTYTQETESIAKTLKARQTLEKKEGDATPVYSKPYITLEGI